MIGDGPFSSFRQSVFVGVAAAAPQSDRLSCMAERGLAPFSGPAGSPVRHTVYAVRWVRRLQYLPG